MGYKNEIVEQNSRIRVRKKASREKKRVYEDLGWENNVLAAQRARYGYQEEHMEEDPILADEWIARADAVAEYESVD